MTHGSVEAVAVNKLRRPSRSYIKFKLNIIAVQFCQFMINFNALHFLIAINRSVFSTMENVENRKINRKLVIQLKQLKSDWLN